jgi:CheY-like chemotaxis protein
MLGAKFPNLGAFVASDYHRQFNCSFVAMTRILLVEDSPDVLFVLRIELESLGYEVDAAVDPNMALLAAKRNPPDVIVSDLGMPGMDGYEFIKRIRQSPKLALTPAIALTGATTDRDIQTALACGFTAHMRKPVEPNELGKRIEQLTARRLQRNAS